MLYLLVQGLLTIGVWRKGWRWKSLIPLGVGAGIGFVIGIVSVLVGADINDFPAWIWFTLEMGIVIALVIMGWGRKIYLGYMVSILDK